MVHGILTRIPTRAVGGGVERGIGTLTLAQAMGSAVGGTNRDGRSSKTFCFRNQTEQSIKFQDRGSVAERRRSVRAEAVGCSVGGDGTVGVGRPLLQGLGTPSGGACHVLARVRSEIIETLLKIATCGYLWIGLEVINVHLRLA